MIRERALKVVLMERFGATKNGSMIGKRLKDMVGTWGLEPQTSTVSR
jgi:hypothetical protein